MQENWQDEVHLRARSDVSEKAWRRLEALHAKDERLLELHGHAVCRVQRVQYNEAHRQVHASGDAIGVDA